MRRSNRWGRVAICVAMVVAMIVAGMIWANRTSDTGECSAWQTSQVRYRACRLELEDTRRVTCIVTSQGGISCDWVHADGSDMPPSSQ